MAYRSGLCVNIDPISRAKTSKNTRTTEKVNNSRTQQLAVVARVQPNVQAEADKPIKIIILSTKAGERCTKAVLNYTHSMKRA